MTSGTPKILLIGSDAALLEGLSQSLSALGYAAHVARELAEAEELASPEAPVIVVGEGAMAARSGADLLRIPLAPGGARVLYHGTGEEPSTLIGPLQRAVLADLALPLERHRLVALIQHVVERAGLRGRRLRDTPPEQMAQ